MCRPPVEILKRRRDFLAVRGGGRWRAPAFILEGKRRSVEPAGPVEERAACARIGYTVTKKLGSAVVRNRIRRRLRHAIGEVAAIWAEPGCDYVVIASAAALRQPFAGLVEDARIAFDRVNQRLKGHRRPRA